MPEESTTPGTRRHNARCPETKPNILSQNAPYDTRKHTKSRFSSQPDQKQDKLFGTIQEKASKALSYDSNHRQEAFQPSRD